MYSCGYGLFGSLGHGDNLDCFYPKLIDIDAKIIQISCKEHLNVALDGKFIAAHNLW